LCKILVMKGIEGKILKLRMAKGISKADMSRACGITPTAYSNIEDDLTESINIETGRKIAAALGISFNELFEIEGDSLKIDRLENIIEEQKQKIEDLKGRLTDKELLIRYFSKSNQNIKDYLVKKIRDEYRNKENELFMIKLPIDYAKWTPENIASNNYRNEQLDLLNEKIKDEYRAFISFGILEQSDIDKYVEFYKGGKKEQL
jgi:transcriptional regulator with XRE-family HTH domain